MQDRSYKVWGWARGLIYVPVGIVSSFAAGWFIRYPTPSYTTLEKVPSVLMPLAWCFAGWMLYRYREAWAGKLVFSTAEGVSVWGEPATRDWMTQGRQVHAEALMGEVIRFWANYFIRAGHSDASAVLADWFNGTNIEVVITAEGVSSPRHGIRKKAGLASPKRIWLQLSPVDMATGAAFFATLGHEAGHECLFAFDVPDADQERFMKQAGFPYA